LPSDMTTFLLGGYDDTSEMRQQRQNGHPMPDNPKQDQYDNPLVSRYASAEMSELWSPQRKFSTWRRLWVALAEAEKTLGLPITQPQINQLKNYVDNINFDVAAQYEQKLRHDVMAHVHAYGVQCPDARAIIHLGATSCYVTDNTDLLLLREGLQMIAHGVAVVILSLAKFAAKYRDVPCLGFTHFQPAQPTTVGKRACLWAYDFAMDLAEIEHRIATLKALGNKGTTGTQASFLKLFHGNHERVKKLEKLICRKIGFKTAYAASGQTYSRKIDFQVLTVLSGVAQSAHKMATDLRLLAHREEVEEPFEADQIGSSAMPYKRNPMRSERICSLARFVVSLESNAAQTASVQWLERTLDDSANRRLTLPQAFLATDAVLILCQNVAAGLVINPKVLDRELREELPLIATENILMAAVAAGGDRQDLHTRLSKHSYEAAAFRKEQGGHLDLMDRLANDPKFPDIERAAVLEPSKFVGRAPQQVDEFLEEVVQPIRKKYVRPSPEIERRSKHHDKVKQSDNCQEAAERIAQQHLAADPGIMDVWYLPTNAPGDEIRLVEVNSLLAELADNAIGPVDFELQVHGSIYRLLVVDVTPAQWERQQTGTSASLLPEGWNLKDAQHFGYVQQ
jgi:adenylosuccinate lyase